MANVLGSWISDLVFDRRSREDSASAPVLDHGQMAAFGLSAGHEADGLVSKVARRRAEKPQLVLDPASRRPIPPADLANPATQTKPFTWRHCGRSAAGHPF